MKYLMIAVLTLLAGCTNVKRDDLIIQTPKQDEWFAISHDVAVETGRFNQDAKARQFPFLRAGDVENLNARDVARLRLAMRYNCLIMNELLDGKMVTYTTTTMCGKTPVITTHTRED